MFQKILVGTDGSPRAGQAVARAAALAESTGAELIVLSAYSTDEGAEGAEATLAKTAKTYVDHFLRTIPREAHAADAIIDTAEEEAVDLIVLGDKGMTGARRFFLGSVPNRVSHHAQCSLLIVKTDRPPVEPDDGDGTVTHYRRLVAGTDGSDTSLKAVREAARLSAALQAELVLVCAYHPLDPELIDRWKQQAGPDIAWRINTGMLAEAALERAGSVAAEAGVTARPRMELGEPASTLVGVAEEEGADLLVVGNVGMTGPTRFLMGSVPNKVSHHSPCDLLIVKTT